MRRDRDAVVRILAARPRWTGIERAGSLLDLPEGLLLHAGPPFESPEAITRPVLNSAIHSTLFEGWARDAAAAEAMIRAGEISLRPAQELRACVPLAATLSPSMAAQVVEDADAPERRICTPLNPGMTPPHPIGGSADPATVGRLRFVNGEIAPLMARLFGKPLDLLALIDASLRGGDECHGSTKVATATIREVAAERLPAGPERDKLLAFLDEAPLYFLNLAMAASKVMMLAAEGTEGSAIVTSAGGNGRDFGIRLAGLPERWFVAPAEPPRGFFFNDSLAEKLPLGAIGDSAVIDSLGFGGQALACAPELRRAFDKVMPESALGLPATLLEAVHPLLLGGEGRIGLNARRVVGSEAVPLAVLAILDASGEAGLIGRGLFTAPLAPFREAVAALESPQ